jgi:prepilin-type N-terminal cleavage/methylation domain-containing protein
LLALFLHKILRPYLLGSFRNSKGFILPRSGFSLVELSIVLVILGLLIGGILSGQSLIRAAELRSVSTEYQRYVTAVSTFKDKYFATPGDMTNAVSFWTAAANCPGNASQGSTTSATCNGNGNGRLWDAAASNEMFRFWQHLANAGLIEGTYSGVSGRDDYTWVGTATNSPRSKINQGLWLVASYNNASGAFTGSLFYNDLGRFFTLGAPASFWNSAAILKPEEAWNIDAKIDDGMPGRGKVTANVANGCNNAASGASFDATYTLSATTTSCMLAFIQAF